MILVIPHIPYLHVRIRSFELAKGFARLGYPVKCLTWPESHGEIVQYGELSFVKMPMADFGKAINISKRLNMWRLGRWIQKHKIDTVINASALWWSIMPKPKTFYIYDVVDDHIRQTSGYPHLDRALDNHFDTECRKANLVTASSLEQVRLIEDRVGVKPLYVPNGVDIAAYRSVTPERVREKRERLGLENKWVIGYIGNHNYWSGMGFLLKVFDRLRKQYRDAHLLIVGGGAEVDAYVSERSNDPDVTFLGFRPILEMPTLFNLIDVGVLSFRRISFTESALPLKVLEYSACRKHVVASRLRELENQHFPNVELVPENDIQSWVISLKNSRKKVWHYEWDRQFNQFDWLSVVQGMIKEIEARR